MKKLVIIDEYFVDTFGHFYEYNKSVQDIFKEHGMEAVIYANDKLEAPIQKELGAVPYFMGLPKNALNKIPVLGRAINRLRFWLSLHSRIMKLYAKEGGEGVVFFFTTVRWYNVLPVAMAASKSQYKNILLYRFPISMHPDLYKFLAMTATWIYNYTFGKLMKNRNVLFCTDSDVIADECNQMYDCHMAVLPIPHITDEHSPKAEQGVAQSMDTFRLYAPGSIREEKGIRFITDTLEYMASINHPLLQKLTLVTQYYNGADTRLNSEIRQRLEKLPIKNVFLGNMTTDAYYEQMNTADIMLITYDPECGYKARTSGILSETIAACKPFITSKDSWMNVQAEKYNTGLGITYGNREEFITALNDIVNNYAPYKERALKAKTGWLAYHSKTNFFKLTMELINSK